jgi:hypothetical protein
MLGDIGPLAGTVYCDGGSIEKGGDRGPYGREEQYDPL